MSERDLRRYNGLADWRRKVAESYAAVRKADYPLLAWERWVDSRNQLFKEHSQTPLMAKQRSQFESLPYFDYDLALRIMGRVRYDVEPEEFRVELKEDGLLCYKRVAEVRFRLENRPQRLSLFWIMGYGGGLFLPFKDGTSGDETYGGGRYLFDAIKGADLGLYADSIVLDFNFAYNPSCAYNDIWSCPLAPAENWLAAHVKAGEKRFVQ